MSQPLQKRNEMREIRAAIKAILRRAPQGMGLNELAENVYTVLPDATYEQIKRQVFIMQGNGITADRSHARNIYFLDGAVAEPPEPEHLTYKPRAVVKPPLESKREVMPVRQRTVPAAAGLFTADRRTPIEWCVDVLAGAA